MELERLLELAGVPVTEETEYLDKDLKAKVKKEFAKTAGMDDKAIEIVAKKLNIPFAKAKELLDEAIITEAGSAVSGKFVKKPKPGQQFGATDQAAPEDFTPAQLSRLADAMYYANKAGLSPQKVFSVAPQNMKGEWNYSNWKYVAE